jgi:FkbM family methyltransferase
LPDFRLQNAILRLPAPLRRQKLLRAVLTVFPGSCYHAIRFNGSAIVGDIRDAYVANTLLKRAFADYGYFALAREILEPGTVHFDVGANAGFHTFGLLPFGEPVAIRCYLFEPNPYCVLSHRLSRQLYTEAVLESENVAVGDGDGDVHLRFDPRNTVGGFLADDPGSPQPDGTIERAVPMVRLDDYIAAHRVSCVRLMKMDIEGSETRALRGARQSMERGLIEHIYFEVNPLALEIQKTSAAELLQLLHAMNYDLFWPHDDVAWIERSYNQRPGYRFHHEHHWLGAARTRRLIRFNVADFTASPNNLMDLLAIHRSVGAGSR